MPHLLFALVSFRTPWTRMVDPVKCHQLWLSIGSLVVVACAPTPERIKLLTVSEARYIRLDTFLAICTVAATQ